MEATLPEKDNNVRVTGVQTSKGIIGHPIISHVIYKSMDIYEKYFS